MADPIKITRAEYEAKFGGQAQPAPVKITRAEFEQRFPTWSPVESAKQFGAGAAESIGSALGFLADINPFQPGGGLGARLGSAIAGQKTDLMPSGRTASELSKEYLPAPDEQYRYARRIGEFVGPTAALGPLGVGGKLLPALGADVVAATAGQAVEDVTGSEAAGLATSLLTPAVAQQAGRSMMNMGKGGQMSALGITRAQIKKSIREAGARNVRGQSPIGKSFDRAKKMGVFKGSKAGDIVWENVAQKMDDLDNGLESVIARADDIKKAPVAPNWAKARKALESQFKGMGDEGADALKHFDNQLAIHESQGLLDGSISNLQTIKRGMYRTGYNGSNVRFPGASKAADRAIAKAAKEAIEDSVESLAKKGKLPGVPPTAIKELNKDYAALIDLQDPLLIQKAAAEGDDVAKKIWRAIRTTGGVGTSLIAGSITGNPLVAAGGIAGHLLFENPRSRYAIGRGMEMAGDVASKMPKTTAGAITQVGKLKSEEANATPTDISIRGVLPQNQISREQFLQENPQIPQSTTPAEDMKVSLRQDVDKALSSYPPIFTAIAKVESSLNPRAKSKAGALGLMQLMPANIKAFGVKDPFNPYESVAASAKLLKEEMNRFKDERLAIAAYNAGSPAINRAIRKAGSRSWSRIKRFLPQETQQYVMKVEREFSKLRG